MQFGVSLPHYGQRHDGESLARYAQTVEEMGYDSLWVSDHIVLPTKRVTPYVYRDLGGDMPPPDIPWLDPMTTLTFLAGVTRRVKLGISVCVLPYRNPVLNAKATASLDVLSGGRLILGVGSGWLPEEAEALGVPFDHRGLRTDEHIQVLKALWTEDEPRFQGRFYRVADLRCEPKPRQQPHPPIWVGGHEPPALKRAGSLGDGWHAYRLWPEELAPRWQEVRTAAKEAGRDPSGLVLSLRTALRINDEAAEGQHALFGNADHIRRLLRQYEELGVSHMVFDVSHRYGLETLERFANEIRAEFVE